MKTYTLEQIASARAQFVEEGFPQFNAQLAGEIFNYFVLPQSLNHTVHYFTLAMTNGKPFEGELYAVSEAVPAELMPYAVLSDVIEARKLSHLPARRSSAATMKVVRIVPQEMKRDFILVRRKFFDGLVGYAKSVPEMYSPSDIDDFERSLNLLDALLKCEL